MTGKVFISYRRDDSAGHAGRVHDRLQLEFGRDLLFMDVDAVPLGVNFIKILREGVAECDALLAVIGPNWLDLPDKEGNRRLDDPHDYVRIEIAAALQRDIPVIPVLLDGAEMPRVDQLPKDIAELALRNGLYVRHASFHSDVDRLIEGLKGPLGQLDAPPAPIARRSPTKKRARTGTAERKVAAEAKPEQETPKITPWLRPITIAIGSAIVLAVGIFGFVIVKGPPTSSSPPSMLPNQFPPQAPQQQPDAKTPVPQTAQPLAAPVPALPQTSQRPSAETQLEPYPQVPAASAQRTLRPGDSFKDCDGCPEMVVVPAGAFTMGSPENEQGRFADESPQHVVTVAQPFAVGKFEVTVDQFTEFVKETAYDAGGKCLTLEEGKSAVRDGRTWRDPGYPQTGSHPVACVNWSDTKAYLGWLAKKTGKQYRLLTEAEWEYAARATTSPGSGSRYTFGDDDSAMCRYGNVADKTARQTIPGAATWAIYPCSDGYAYAAPVGTFSANAFGLYDVHGNVWEWTEDCYNNSYNGAPTDGSPWIAGDCDLRVVRGGMWGSSPANVRLARRLKHQSDERSQDTGFRVARALAP
jgi:formylglycine-generating enzyme required for sulfatase activity